MHLPAGRRPIWSLLIFSWKYIPELMSSGIANFDQQIIRLWYMFWFCFALFFYHVSLDTKIPGVSSSISPGTKIIKTNSDAAHNITNQDCDGKAYLTCPFFHLSPSCRLIKYCLSAINIGGCNHIFSLLINGSRLVHGILEVTVTGKRFDLRRGFSFSGGEETAEDGWGQYTVGDITSPLELKISALGGVESCTIGKSQSWLLLVSWEGRKGMERSSIARSIAAASSLRHLLNFSDISPEREK